MRDQEVFGPKRPDALMDGEHRSTRGNDRNLSAHTGNPGFLASVVTVVGIGFVIWVLLTRPFPG